MTSYPLSSCLLFLIFINSLNCQSQEGWASGLKILLRNCSPKLSETAPPKHLFGTMRECLQRRALIAFDAVFSDNVIPVVNGIDLVRRPETASDSERQYRTEESRGGTSAKTWKDIVFARIARVFRTHVLRIDIQGLTEAKSTSDEAAMGNAGHEMVEGRRRHHRRRNQLFPMMMMGLLIMGSVLIPMGFQFLAVLGGKALILAKLALMLSSIQGLKRIATSGVNYGLYHADGGWHDRSHHETVGSYDMPYQAYQRP